MRALLSLTAGIIVTIIGFRIGSRVLQAPVWCASWIVAHYEPRASNVVQNLTYLATNILSWAVVTYLLLTLFRKSKASNHEN